MLIVLGALLWAAIGAMLGLAVNSEAFAQGWSEADTDEESSPAEKQPADDQNDRRLVVIGTVSAVVAGLISMVVIIGEGVVGLLVSLPVSAIGAGAVLLVVSAMGLSAEQEHGED
ncbi:hypothetical protein ABIE52_006790 [Rhodococcus sp. OAS809]|uniref:hypothetical protein n=1 Tax=Rhodococcus sp. OAS809 TaxID=2663874 RepID=UPI00178B0436